MEHERNAAETGDRRCPECNGFLETMDAWEICESCGKACYHGKNSSVKQSNEKRGGVASQNCG